MESSLKIVTARFFAILAITGKSGKSCPSSGSCQVRLPAAQTGEPVPGEERQDRLALRWTATAER